MLQGDYLLSCISYGIRWYSKTFFSQFHMMLARIRHYKALNDPRVLQGIPKPWKESILIDIQYDEVRKSIKLFEIINQLYVLISYSI